MKRLIAGLAAALMLTGCAHRYDVTLTNGMRLTNVTKPKLDRESGVYTYRDVTGQQRTVVASHVVEIDTHASRRVTNQPGQ
jgi:hypothetical protein